MSFDPAEFKDKDFWFTKGFVKLCSVHSSSHVDISEAIDESTKKQEETKNKENAVVAKVLAQQVDARCRGRVSITSALF